MPTFTLITKVLKSQPSAAGDEVYQGGEVHDPQSQRMVATFGIVMNTITGVTNIQNLDTSLFSLQLFFTETKHGHGGGGQGQGGGHQRGQAPETIVLDGANEFDGGPNQPQPRQTDRAQGSVAAASPLFASLKDHQWTLERTGQVQNGFNVLKLNITP